MWLWEAEGLQNKHLWVKALCGAAWLYASQCWATIRAPRCSLSCWDLLPFPAHSVGKRHSLAPIGLLGHVRAHRHS